MTLPVLDARGLLPAGIHDSDWSEIQDRFCWNAHRLALFSNVRLFVANELPASTSTLELCLGGSFFSDKPTPYDVEGTIAIPPTYFSTPDGLTLLLGYDHDRIMAEYRLDFYLTLEGTGLRDLREFFQYVGPKTAAMKGLQPKDRRGVVRMVQWAIG